MAITPTGVTFTFGIVDNYGENNGDSRWTHDMEFRPQRVVAQASMPSFSPDPGGASGAAGIIEYRTRDGSGADSIHTIPGQMSPVVEGLVPSLRADHCDSVTFLADVEGGSDGTIIMVNFTVFFWT